MRKPRPGDPDPAKLNSRGKLVLPEMKYGPAMQALVPRWRRFVHCYLAGGGRNATQAYLDAGFQANRDTAQASASRLLHDQRVQDALREETKKMMLGAAPLALGVVTQILDDPTASKKDQLTAAKMVWDRTGFHAAMENVVKHEHSLNSEQMKLEVAQFAKEMGLDLTKILGNVAEEPKALIAVDADYDEVEEPIDMHGLEDLF